MRALLVNPPHSLHDRAELGPPLGLLRLANVARRAGCEVDVLDLNLQWHLSPSLRENFYEVASSLICESTPDVLGITSMAVDSHVALELGRRVKARLPGITIVLGGTHFSAIAEEVQLRYSWIDHVIRGEGENSFMSLLQKRAPAQSSASIPAIVDYSCVDFSSYSLANPLRVADVESSRGCRFKCSFCYSPIHYPRRTSLDLTQLQQELSYLASAGIRHVFLVEDNFLNDESRALTVCSAIKELNLELTWHAYATMPQLTSRVVSAMAVAGCRAVFTGIDAIGGTSERQYAKRFSHRADERIRLCVDNDIVPTCAFLVAPPSHPCGADANATVHAALAARDLGANIRLNVLTPYTSTRIGESIMTPLVAEQYRVELQMDVPEIVVCNDYAAAAPHLFPFHSRYVGEGEWRRFAASTHVLFTLLHARGVELLDMSAKAPIDYYGLAQSILRELGELSEIPKSERRQYEVDCFDDIYQMTGV